jgi:hypothetical protein
MTSSKNYIEYLPIILGRNYIKRKLNSVFANKFFSEARFVNSCSVSNQQLNFLFSFFLIEELTSENKVFHYEMYILFADVSLFLLFEKLGKTQFRIRSKYTLC